jgi:hypothetical protein
MDDNRSDDEEKRSNSDPFEWLNLIVSEPYYLFHFLVFFSYIPIRFSASQFLSPQFSLHLLHREIQAVLAFSVLTLIKVVKEETWEAFAADTIFFAKIFLVAISLVMDYHLAIWYTLIFFVTYNVAQQSPFQGLGMVNQLTPLQLEAMFTDGNSSKFCLVEFRSLSSSTCIRSSRIGPELSITFSNKLLSFGVVDLGVFPNTAEKFGISPVKVEFLKNRDHETTSYIYTFRECRRS